MANDEAHRPAARRQGGCTRGADHEGDPRWECDLHPRSRFAPAQSRSGDGGWLVTSGKGPCSPEEIDVELREVEVLPGLSKKAMEVAEGLGIGEVASCRWLREYPDHVAAQVRCLQGFSRGSLVRGERCPTAPSTSSTVREAVRGDALMLGLDAAPPSWSRGRSTAGLSLPRCWWT